MSIFMESNIIIAIGKDMTGWVLWWSWDMKSERARWHQDGGNNRWCFSLFGQMVCVQHHPLPFLYPSLSYNCLVWQSLTLWLANGDLTGSPPKARVKLIWHQKEPCCNLDWSPGLESLPSFRGRVTLDKPVKLSGPGEWMAVQLGK